MKFLKTINKNLFKYMLVILIFVICILVVQISSIYAKPAQKFEVQKIDIIGQYHTGDNNWKTIDQYFDDNIYGKSEVYIKGAFDKEIPENHIIVFTAININIQVKIDDEVIFDFGSYGTYPENFKSAGQTVSRYTSGGITKNNLLEIKIKNPHNHMNKMGANRFLDRILVGDSQTINSFFNSRLYIVYLSGFLVIGIGVMIALITFLFRIGDKPLQKLSLAFAIFAISGGYYIVTDVMYPYMGAFIKNSLIASMIDILPVFSMQIAAYLCAMASIKDVRLKKNIEKIILFNITVCTVCIIFQIVGLVDLYQSHLPASLLGLLCACGIMTILYQDGFIRKNYASRNILITFTPVLIGGALELVNSHFDIMPIRVSATTGIILSCLLQIYQIRYLAKRHAEEKEKAIQIKAELIQAQISIMLSQIQPHFLYNALNTIEYLCDTQPQQASLAIHHFSKYLRTNMDALTHENPVLLREDILHLENYLYIEKLRFPDIKIIYNITCENFFLPILTLQPLVENAIKHGVRQLDFEGKITISSSEDDKNFYLCISDNGIGFDVNATFKKEGRSHIGLENTKERLKAKCNATLLVESIISKGTKVTITLPKENNNENNYSR